MTNADMVSAMEALQMKHTIFGPLIGEALAHAKAALLEGKVVEMGSCSLHPDKDLDVIWGVDPYGQDCIAASNLSDKGHDNALIWIASAGDTRGHPAEFCY